MMNRHISFVQPMTAFFYAGLFLLLPLAAVAQVGSQPAPLCHPNDCNFNGVYDDIETMPYEDSFTGPYNVYDINQNRIPDECELDCNRNGYPDEYDVNGPSDAPGYFQPNSYDSNGNGIPDECETDCNRNGFPDDYDVNGPADAPDYFRTNSYDSNANGIPDECELDCNRNGFPDDYDVNGPADAPQYYQTNSYDSNENGIPDECEVDCNRNGFPDDYDINGPAMAPPGFITNSQDSDENGVPDECERKVVLEPTYVKPFEVTASSTYTRSITYYASNAIDDNLQTFWAGNFYEKPYELNYRFEDTIALKSIELFVNVTYIPSSVEVEVSSGAGIREKANFEDKEWESVPGQSHMKKKVLNFDSIRGDQVFIRFPNSSAPTVILYESRFIGLAGVLDDCNFNGVDDTEELERNSVERANCQGYSYNSDCINFIDKDINWNSKLDVCEADCNKNYLPDSYEIERNSVMRTNCQDNNYSSECVNYIDIDLNWNSIVDACEADCNKNYVPDSYEIERNSVMRTNCQDNNYSSECVNYIDIDLNWNSIVDACEADCNKNYVPDSYEIERNSVMRTNCQGNNYSSECVNYVDIDLNWNETVDMCEEDCNNNFIPDSYEIELNHTMLSGSGNNCYYDTFRGYVCDIPRPIDANDDGVIDVCQLCPAAATLCSLKTTSNSIYENYGRYGSANVLDGNQSTFWVSNWSNDPETQGHTTLSLGLGASSAEVLYLELDWFNRYGAEFSIEISTVENPDFRVVYSGVEPGSSENSPTTTVVPIEEQQVTEIRVIIQRPTMSVAVLSEARIVGISEEDCSGARGR